MAPHLKLSQTCFPSCLLCFRVVGSTQITHSSRIGGRTNWQTDKCLPHLTSRSPYGLFPSFSFSFNDFKVFFLTGSALCASGGVQLLSARGVHRFGGEAPHSYCIVFRSVVHDITQASNSERIKCQAVILVKTLRPCACRWVGGSFFQILFVLIQSRNKQTSPPYPTPSVICSIHHVLGSARKKKCASYHGRLQATFQLLPHKACVNWTFAILLGNMKGALLWKGWKPYGRSWAAVVKYLLAFFSWFERLKASSVKVLTVLHFEKQGQLGQWFACDICCLASARAELDLHAEGLASLEEASPWGREATSFRNSCIPQGKSAQEFRIALFCFKWSYRNWFDLFSVLVWTGEAVASLCERGVEPERVKVWFLECLTKRHKRWKADSGVKPFEYTVYERLLN